MFNTAKSTKNADEKIKDSSGKDSIEIQIDTKKSCKKTKEIENYSFLYKYIPVENIKKADSLDIRYLELEGGGIRAIGFLGALSLLDLSNLKAVSGVSAGALVGMLLAIGYTPKELLDILPKIDFEGLKDDDFGCVRDLSRFLFKKYGWYKGDKLKNLVKGLIKAKGFSEDVTFKELHDKRVKQTNQGLSGLSKNPRDALDDNTKEFIKQRKEFSKIKDLYINATNLNTGYIETFSFENKNYKDTPIWQAVYASMVFPAAFPGLIIADKDGVKDYFLDPGITNALPSVFEKEKYFNPKSMNPERKCENKFSVGIRIDTSDEIKQIKNNVRPRKKITNVFGYFIALLQARDAAFIENRDLSNNKSLKKKIIFVDDGGIDTLQFDLSSEQIAKLIKNGELAAKQFFLDRLESKVKLDKPFNDICNQYSNIKTKKRLESNLKDSKNQNRTRSNRCCIL